MSAAAALSVLQIEGAHCQGCVRKIRTALQAQGVDPKKVEVDLPGQRVYLPQSSNLEAAAEAITSVGFPAQPLSESADVSASANVDSRSEPKPRAESEQEPSPASQQDSPSQGTVTVQRFQVSGATCASCVRTIEQALQRVPSTERAQMNLANHTATAWSGASLDTLMAAVREAGYGAEPLTSDDPSEQQAASDRQQRREMKALAAYSAIALIWGFGLMFWGMTVGSMEVTRANQPLWIGIGITSLLVLVVTARHFFRSGWNALRHHQANMDTLVALGSGTAWLYSMIVALFPDLFVATAGHVYFEASAMIVGLINFGQVLERRAKGKTSQAIRRLLDLRPKQATLLRDGQEQRVPIEQLVLGDRVRIRPGEQVPVDGIVVEGETTVNESMLTGEAMPSRKGPEDELSAGTLNNNGTVVLETRRVGDDTALARIVALVREAQSAKPALGQLADRISSVFVPAVLLIAIATALAWYNLGPEPVAVHMLVAATAVLIIACPCALGLATPMAVMVGVGKAADYGVLIRDGEAFQRAGEVNLVILDKTGTVTKGEPEVVQITAADENRCLALASAIEQHSQHPLARAVMDFAAGRDITPANITGFHSHAGHGVSASFKTSSRTKALRLGQPAWLESEGVSLDDHRKTLARFEGAALTPVAVALDDQCIGLLGLADGLKADSEAAVARLRKAGLKVVMVTGDGEATAKAVAEKAGIDEVHAGVLPEDKAALVKFIRAEGHVVAMVGDGINDAPALAAADVGLAIGTGTDVAIESASLTLMSGSLNGVADAIEISRATTRNIRQNLFFAFFYNLLGIPLAAGVLYPIWGLTLSPVYAAAAMSLSSVTVVTNANRLRRFQSSRQGARP